jgi:hypothetical protein
MQKALCSKICLSSYQSGLKSIFVDELSCGGLQLLADVDHRHAGLHPTLDVLTGLPVSFGGLERIEKNCLKIKFYDRTLGTLIIGPGLNNCSIHKIKGSQHGGRVPLGGL